MTQRFICGLKEIDKRLKPPAAEAPEKKRKFMTKIKAVVVAIDIEPMHGEDVLKRCVSVSKIE